MPLFENPDESAYSVTIKSDRIVSGVRNTPEYQDDDSSAIYRMLVENLKPVDFSYYLKRYLYRAAGYRKEFGEVSEEECLATISRVNRSLNYGSDGYDMIFKRLDEAEQNQNSEIEGEQQ